MNCVGVTNCAVKALRSVVAMLLVCVCVISPRKNRLRSWPPRLIGSWHRRFYAMELLRGNELPVVLSAILLQGIASTHFRGWRCFYAMELSAASAAAEVWGNELPVVLSPTFDQAFWSLFVNKK